MDSAAVLDQVCRLLRGQPVSHPAWNEILELANLALITPRLEHCLEAAEAPADVSTFVREVADRNRQRNRRLFEAMGEAAAKLNAVDVTPLVIKGGACLARTGGRCDRVLSDLYLVVRPDQIDLVVTTLGEAGFSVLNRYSGADLHAIAELARPTDVGAIDLHQRPPGPPGFVSRQAILQGAHVTPVGAGRVRTPAPHMHIFLQALHDQLHDGGYWRGGFDLRHAWDIADLIRDEPSMDWAALRDLPQTTLTAHAVNAQILACHALTGAPIPADAKRLRARLHYRRQHLQYRFPSLRNGVAVVAMISEAANLGPHRRQDSLARETEGLPPVDSGFAASLDRLRQILAPPPAIAD
jgi:hypothetical protein